MSLSTIRQELDVIESTLTTMATLLDRVAGEQDWHPGDIVRVRAMLRENARYLRKLASRVSVKERKP